VLWVPGARLRVLDITRATGPACTSMIPSSSKDRVESILRRVCCIPKSAVKFLVVNLQVEERGIYFI
jgi:hypothetical protein